MTRFYFLIIFFMQACSFNYANASTTVSFNNVNYSVPAKGDENWGVSLSNYLIAISNYTLQPKGGTFTLTSDVDFGANYGIKSVFFKSKNANPASAGQIRLGNTESIKWRNAASNADFGLAVNASNWLQYNSIDLADISTSQTLTNKSISGSANTLSNVPFSALVISSGDIAYSKLNLSNSILNADVNASAAIAYSKLNLSSSITNSDIKSDAAIALSKLAALTSGKVLQSNASTGLIEASGVTNTTLSYLDATSSIQTQINSKINNSIVDAKGDLITATANDTPARLAIGSNNQVLTADSAEATGMKWATPASNPVTTKGDIATFSTTADRLPVGTDGQVLTADSTVALGLSYQPAMSKNYIINGDMGIAQRGTSFSSAANNTYSVDRWQYKKVGAQVHTITQDTDVPTFAQAGYLFQNSLRLNLTTPNSSPSPGDYSNISQQIEGYNFAKLAQKQFSLSFWVKATTVGTYNCRVTNFVGDRSLVKTFTINTTSTWEKKTFSFAASPSDGTWNYNNGVGLYVQIVLLSTSGAQTSTLDTWISGDYMGSSAAVNGTATGSTDFRITGVMLNEGSIAMPFQTAGANYQQELAMCQRYYEKGFAYIDLYGVTGANYSVHVNYKVTKRVSAAPTPVYISSVGMSNTPAISDYNTDFFNVYHAATATGNANFLDSWSVNAEL